MLHYPRRKLVLVQAIEMPILGRIKENEYEKEHLLGMLQGLVEKAPLSVRFGERVQDVQREGGLFAVSSTSGVTLARFVLLALGRRGTPRKLGVPGEELSKVMYRLVDAESYQNQRILVVGGGDSAVEAALGLARQRGNRVALSYRREKLVRIKKKNEDRIAQLLANKRIDGLFSSEVERITPASVFVRDGDRRARAAERLRVRLRGRRAAVRAAAQGGSALRWRRLARPGRVRGPGTAAVLGVRLVPRSVARPEDRRRAKLFICREPDCGLRIQPTG